MTPLARWADELRSTNALIEFALRHALADAGRPPGHAGTDAPRQAAACRQPAEAARSGRGDDRSADTAAAWLEQAPPTIAAGSPYSASPNGLTRTLW
jgi:hypothetical protein